MSNERDPTKHKCKPKWEDVVSVVLAIGISILALGLLITLFKPGDSGGGFIKAEGSIGGSVTVGGLLDKEEESTDNTTPDTDNNGADTDTDTGEGTDTENDNTADTDTTPGDSIDEDSNTGYIDPNGWT